GQIGQQNELAWLVFHSPDFNTDPTTVFQRHFVAIITAGGEAALDHVDPAFSVEWLAKQRHCRRIALANDAALIQHHYTRRQRLEESRQTIGQLLFLFELLLTLARFVGEFAR